MNDLEILLLALAEETIRRKRAELTLLEAQRTVEALTAKVEELTPKPAEPQAAATPAVDKPA